MIMFLAFIPTVCAEDQRPVYVISDGITNNAVDNARINQVVKALKDAGVKEVYNGYPGRNGVKVNNYYILQKTPKDAVIVQLMGGLCAATIYSMTMENYYKNLRGTRDVYPIWVYPSVRVDIDNIGWLGRSGDDGGHGAFSGISNPAQKLKANGYGYAYWKTNNDFNVAIQEIAIRAGVKQKKKSSSGTRAKPPASTVTIGGCTVYKEFPSNYPLRYGLKNGKYVYSKNKYVKVTQIQLRKKVGYNGYCEGNFGPKTKLYVLKFQKKEKLPQTGKVDKKTWKRLIS